MHRWIMSADDLARGRTRCDIMPQGKEIFSSNYADRYAPPS
jgi:hypothetical protein